jgi:DNA-binding NarL/FixJ family response regulator
MESAAETGRTRILIDLSNRLFGEAVKELLARHSDRFVTTVSAGCGQTAEFLPHKIIVDAPTLARNHLARWPDAKLILIDTGLAEEEIIGLLFAHRLHGIIATDTTPELFLKALAAIRSGQVWIDNRKIKALLHAPEAARRPKVRESLSRREREIVQLIAQGLRNRQIAERLSVSEQTVKAHLSRLFKRFGVASRTQLVPLALQYRNPPL